jgi:hypothetical protein
MESANTPPRNEIAEIAARILHEHLTETYPDYGWVRIRGVTAAEFHERFDDDGRRRSAEAPE